MRRQVQRRYGRFPWCIGQTIRPTCGDGSGTGHAGELGPEREVGDDRATRPHDPRRVRNVRRDNCGGTRPERAGDTVDHEDDLALDDVPHLFLRVAVHVQVRRAGRDVPVRERHVRGVEEATRPARQRCAVDHVLRLEEALGRGHQDLFTVVAVEFAPAVDCGAACNQPFTQGLPSRPLSTTLSSSDPQGRGRTLRAVSTTLTSSEIDDEVLRMFALVADGIARATAAFVEGDDAAARQLVADDLLVNALQHRIESCVERRLTSGDAVGPHEARSLIAVLRIVPELERTGDLVEHIALRTPRGMAAELTPRCRSLVAEMGQIAAAMWLLAAEAYARGDRSAAAQLRRRDDALDDLHVSLTAELAASDISVAAAIEMGLVARFYERLGDHAVNVARRMRGHDDAGQAIGA